MADEEEHRVTLGEVWRGQQAGFERLDKRLSDLSRDMVGRAEYESDQEAVDARFSRIDDTMKDWRDTSTGEHVRLDGRIEAVTTRLNASEERGKNQRWAVVLAVIVGVVSLASSIISGIVQGAIGP